MNISYNIWGRTESSMVYLAKPGKRLIGAIQGIEQSSGNLQQNLNSTWVLEFQVYRIIDGEINPFYEYIAKHYELYLTNFGWFKINEEPTLENDGKIESKTVRAESLEIELQQYDLTNFEINTGSVSSKELLATDNTYQLDGYNLFRDQVKFYRDTTNLAALSEVWANNHYSTLSQLKSLYVNYPGIETSWRLDYDYSTFDTALENAATEIEPTNPVGAAFLRGVKEKIADKDSALQVIKAYPVLRKYVGLTLDTSDGQDGQYTIQEVINMELARQNELSFLWLVLHEHGWTVGEVDDYVNLDSTVPSEREFLKDRVGTFEVTSQDIYSFLTQQAAQYYRCIFVFDTENCTVSAYKVENIGNDTNIYLSFKNIQNSVTRDTSREIYTVYTVRGAEDLSINEVNFGSDKVEDLSYFMNTDHFSEEFIEKYNRWLELIEMKRPVYMQLSKDYRNQLDIVSEIYNRVPLDGSNTKQYSTFNNGQLMTELANYQAQIAGYRNLYVDTNGDFDENACLSSPDGKDYKMILEQIIPNIQIEITNRTVNSRDEETEFLDGYKYDFDTYGDSYGLAELQIQQTVLKNSMDALSNYRDPVENTADLYSVNQHEMYVKYKDAYDSCTRALAIRQQQYDDENAVLDGISQKLTTIKNQVQKSNYFTEEEMALLDKYYIYTDYVNENILVTDQFTNDEIIDTQYELLESAREYLSADCQPQWTWQTTNDNLLLIPEFRDWHGYLSVGNFVRVEWRDGQQIKLRVITIEFNPFMMETEINIGFSTMIQYKSKRNDFIELLDLAQSSTKNQIYAAISGASTTNDITVNSALLLKLMNNATFSSYINSYIDGASASSVIGTISGMQGMLSEMISGATIHVDQIVGTRAQFEEIFTDYLQANTVVTKFLQADSAYIQELTAEIIRVGSAGITQLTRDTIATSKIYADQIVVDDLFTNYVQSISSVSVTEVVDDLYVYNAVAGKISVGDLAAGNIILNNTMQILSENGCLTMNGSALQIHGKDSNDQDYVAIQLGYDTSGTPSFIIRNEENAIIMTADGITQDAIADELIINDMIQDGTIGKDKLGFDIIEPNEYGGIDITSIYDGSGNLWGAQYTSFKNSVESQLQNISEGVSTMSVGATNFIHGSRDLISDYIYWSTDTP